MMAIQMNRSKKAIILLASLPFICGLCMFISASLGISEPYLSPLPLRIIPIFPNHIGYGCGDSEFSQFTREYRVRLPGDTVKEYYIKQMGFYCSDVENVHPNLDTDFYFSISCDLQYQFVYMNFIYGFSKPTTVQYSVMIFPSSNHITQVEETQLVSVYIPGASFMCPD